MVYFKYYEHQVKYMDDRKFIRIKSDFNVWYQTIDEEDISFGKPSSKDISAGGILLEMDEPPESVGTPLLIKFNIPDYDKKIQAKGRIVRTRKLESGNFDVGIQFTDISEEDMSAINDLKQ